MAGSLWEPAPFDAATTYIRGVVEGMGVLMRNRGTGLRLAAAGLSVTFMLTAAGCSGDTAVPVPQSSYAPPSASPAPSDGSEQPASPEAVRNDLARLPLKRAIEAGSLKVRVDYDTRLAVDDWLPEAPKPLHISLTAVNQRKRSQKIYLSKVTATVTALDERGQVGDSRSVTDAANITPGFIVTFPNTYNQDLVLPAVDSSSRRMTVDITYELVLEVDKTKQGSRDFAKQVATDTISVPLRS